MLDLAKASQAQRLADAHRGDLRGALRGFSELELSVLLYTWEFWARPQQLVPPGQWEVLLALAGRGFGKTRMGAEWARKRLKDPSCRMAIIAPTVADLRDTLIEGPSGLMSVCPPWEGIRYEPSKRKITSKSGAVALLYTAEEPERLRGPNFSDAWIDEVAGMDNSADVWEQLSFTLRAGQAPKVLVTTTPKPIPLVVRLAKDPKTLLVRGSSYDNAGNLAPSFLRKLRETYEGTRIGRQEIFAEVLEDVPGALFSREFIEKTRVKTPPSLRRIVVAVDPAPTSHTGSDETGIMVVGQGFDDHLYLLEDLSLRAKPDEWASVVVKAYHKWQADRVVAETNNGGDAVELTLRTIDSNVPFKSVLTRKGKGKRAEPVAAMWEQKKIHVVGGLKKFEDQAAIFTGVNGTRDDRVDAFLHAANELVGFDSSPFFFV